MFFCVPQPFGSLPNMLFLETSSIKPVMVPSFCFTTWVQPTATLRQLGGGSVLSVAVARSGSLGRAKFGATGRQGPSPGHHWVVYQVSWGQILLVTLVTKSVGTKICCSLAIYLITWDQQLLEVVLFFAHGFWRNGMLGVFESIEKSVARTETNQIILIESKEVMNFQKS